MIFLNFTGIYEQQPELTGQTFENAENTMIDLKKMSGVNGYCAGESEAELSALIRQYKPNDIHFLDNGNFHYMSSLFLREIGEPFDLIVFDHHTDMQPPGLIPCLSCGSWVLDSLTDAGKGLNRLQRAVLIGPPAGSAADGAVLIDAAQADFCGNADERTEKVFGEETESSRPVYLSVDKDVLSEDEVKLNWDQGSMSFAVLARMIEAIGRKRRVIGLDICGEPLYNQFPDANVRKSERINLGLAKLARTIMK